MSSSRLICLAAVSHTGRYLALATLLNLVWEILQLPLYTIATTGSPTEQAWAIMHCTAGDALIAASCLAIAVALFGQGAWPQQRYWTVAVAATLTGLGYGVVSERLNVDIRGAWVYAPAMPRLPIVGTGVSPFAQWFVVPTISFLLTRPQSRTA